MTEVQRGVPAAPGSADTGRLYDAGYFAHYDDRSQPGGGAYQRGEPWLSLFTSFAQHIVSDIRPRSVLDAGCAYGLLVEALRDRGIDARGFDVSPYAISQAREDVRPHVWVGSLLEPIPGRYDLVVCLEVLEHLEERDADVAVSHICAVTDDVLFSSTPDDFREETHVNVRPLEYWTELFARHGLVRDLAFDTSFLNTWAARYRRLRDPWERAIAGYDREVTRLRTEARHRNQVVVEQMQELKSLRGEDDSGDEAPATLAAALSEAQGALVQEVRHSQDLERELRRVLVSRTFRAGLLIRRLVRAVAPAGSLRARLGILGVRGTRWSVRKARAAVRLLLRAVTPRRPRGARTELPARHAVEYQEWLARRRPGGVDLLRMRDEADRWKPRPLVSIVMPVYNSERSWLEDAVRSVLDQCYSHWELCMVDDGSTRRGMRELMQEMAGLDPRIKLGFRAQNGGISEATNTALEMATGDFVTFLDHDDFIEPHALYRLVEPLQTRPDLDFVYSDEDKLSPDGKRVNPHFKPDWSPELLLSLNYVTHMALIRRSLVDAAGPLRRETDGAQDYDLFLRCTERTERIAHVPYVLYTWREVPGSAAWSADQKPWAHPAGQRALQAAMARRGIDARVDDGPFTFSYSVHRRITGEPSVAILIPTRDRADLLGACLDSLEELTTYQRRSITILDNDSRSPETHELFQKRGLRVVRARGPFNFSRIVNLGARSVDADYLILLNNDIEVRTPGWIEALLEQAVVPDVAIAGPLLLFPDGRPQHRGILTDREIPFNLSSSEDEFLYPPLCWRVPREVDAVTGACLLVRRTVWNEVGGFDEHLPVAFNDVDFCLRVRERGHRIVFTPRAELVHGESRTRGTFSPDHDLRLFRKRWWGHRDPYMTPNVVWSEGWFRLA